MDVVKVIKKSGGNLLSDVYVFDLYKGQNLDSSKKSLAFSLTFTSITRTLTDDEISVLFNEIIDKVKNTFNAEVRDR